MWCSLQVDEHLELFKSQVLRESLEIREHFGHTHTSLSRRPLHFLLQEPAVDKVVFVIDGRARMLAADSETSRFMRVTHAIVDVMHSKYALLQRQRLPGQFQPWCSACGA
jgi:hypothetical protein